MATEAVAIEPTERVRSQTVSRWVLLVIGAAFLGVAFAQSPGLIEYDTKLPLIAAPIRFFNSLLQLWNPTVFGGTVEQGTGFLFPMGAFFAVAKVLHVPVWIAERIWLATLLTVACWGVVRLAEALGIGNRRSRVIAGVAYAVSPIVVTWVTTSGVLLAVILLPWVLTPLVVGSREGSTRRAAARSGIAVALMGGSNAAVIVAALPLAVIWLITRQPGPRRRSLSLWWLLAVGMACFWWFVPLVYVGHYGYNYLPYTETSTLTTSSASAFEAIRGASFWINYFNIGQPLLQGPWILVSEGAVIVGTAVVAALGLGGLCRRIPERFFLVSSLMFGVLVIAAGYAGPAGGLFSTSVQHLLQGSLAPFRNVSKFSADVTLPLALGLASMLTASMENVRRRLTRFVPTTSQLRVGLTVLAAAAIVVAAAPFWRGALYRSGGFASIPSYWYKAGAFLNQHQGHENALLVPGSSFAYYTWGNPVDEPLQIVASTSVEWRNIIPIGSNGYVQMLDAVEQTLDNGVPTAGLAQYLSLEGINYVVERNDLNLKATGAPPPAEVHQVLSNTPGLTEVASFGPYIALSQAALGQLQVYNSGSDFHLRAVDIYRVDATRSAVQTYPASNPVIVSGGVGSALPLAGAGVLTDRLPVLSGDPRATAAVTAPDATWAITDGNQRRAVAFGSIRYNESYLLGPNQELPNAPYDVPLGFTVVSGSSHETTEVPDGASSMSASSFGSTPIVDDPSGGPAGAFDGNPATAWEANATDNSVGQWVAITFDKALRFSSITVTPQEGSPYQPTITRVKITTDRGSVVHNLPPGKRSYTLAVAGGATRHLKLTIAAARAPALPPLGGIVLGAGITNISIPGLSVTPRMRLPNDESAVFSSPRANAPVVVLTRPLPDENVYLGLVATDDPGMNREFSLPKSENASVSGYAVPQPGAYLNALIHYLSHVSVGSLQVSASSTLGDLPLFSTANLVDGSTQPWIAAPGDRSPSLKLSWPGRRKVSSISLTLSTSAARPTEVSITPAGGTSILRPVPRKGGTISFPPVVTDSLQVRFVGVAARAGVTPGFGVGLNVPVGLAQITVPGLVFVPERAPDSSEQISLPCGSGPTVELDGTTEHSSISGTLGNLIDLMPMHYTVCSVSNKGMGLSPGTHTFSSQLSSVNFAVTTAVIQPVPSGSVPATPKQRTATVVTWAAENRSVKVGAGSATYLVLAQNYNPGWIAHLGSVTLAPIRVDGWEQGYLIPSGKGGLVTLTMHPDRVFRILLVLGAALLIGLLVLALARPRRILPDTGGPRPPLNFWLLLGLSGIALVLVSGPLALVLLPLLLVARRWGPGWMTVVAIGAFITAGVFAASQPAAIDVPGAGAFGTPAQVCSIVALAAVLIALVTLSSMEETREREPASPPAMAHPEAE